MISYIKNRFAVFIALLTFSALTFAQSTTSAVDSTAIVTLITNTITVIAAIGMAVLSLVVTIKLFKWVQRVL